MTQYMKKKIKALIPKLTWWTNQAARGSKTFVAFGPIWDATYSVISSYKEW